MNPQINFNNQIVSSIKGDEDVYCAGANVIAISRPFSSQNKDIFVLLGREKPYFGTQHQGKWSGFGGGTESQKDIDEYHTAAREFYEETLGQVDPFLSFSNQSSIKEITRDKKEFYYHPNFHPHHIKVDVEGKEENESIDLQSKIIRLAESLRQKNYLFRIDFLMSDKKEPTSAPPQHDDDDDNDGDDAEKLKESEEISGAKKFKWIHYPVFVIEVAWNPRIPSNFKNAREPLQTLSTSEVELERLKLYLDSVDRTLPFVGKTFYFRNVSSLEKEEEKEEKVKIISVDEISVNSSSSSNSCSFSEKEWLHISCEVEAEHVFCTDTTTTTTPSLSQRTFSNLLPREALSAYVQYLRSEHDFCQTFEDIKSSSKWLNIPNEVFSSSSPLHVHQEFIEKDKLEWWSLPHIHEALTHGRSKGRSFGKNFRATAELILNWFQFEKK